MYFFIFGISLYVAYEKPQINHCCFLDSFYCFSTFFFQSSTTHLFSLVFSYACSSSFPSSFDIEKKLLALTVGVVLPVCALNERIRQQLSCRMNLFLSKLILHWFKRLKSRKGTLFSLFYSLFLLLLFFYCFCVYLTMVTGTQL